MNKLAALMRRLDYQFADTELLRLALTHRSKSSNNYERLEFLGDSVLGLVVAQWLFEQFPMLSEGKLSRMRSSLVRRETLAEVALALRLGECLRLGEGEQKSGGFNRASILSDAVESIIGAIYLDSDLAAAKDFILIHFASQLAAITPAVNLKDAKSQLQESMQKRGMRLPGYAIVKSEGEQHEQQFTVLCKLDELPIEASATDSSRRKAEQAAAELVLQALAKHDGQNDA